MFCVDLREASVCDELMLSVLWGCILSATSLLVPMNVSSMKTHHRVCACGDFVTYGRAWGIVLSLVICVHQCKLTYRIKQQVSRPTTVE